MPPCAHAHCPLGIDECLVAAWWVTDVLTDDDYRCSQMGMMTLRPAVHNDENDQSTNSLPPQGHSRVTWSCSRRNAARGGYVRPLMETCAGRLTLEGTPHTPPANMTYSRDDPPWPATEHWSTRNDIGLVAAPRCQYLHDYCPFQQSPVALLSTPR